MIKENIWRTFDSTHLAGVIPVSSNKKLFNFPWDDCLMPAGDNYTLVENAVMCCAALKCNTIWIVCNNSSIPLIRKKVGDFVLDPKTSFSIQHIKGHRPRKRYIPIFYVPCNPRDVHKRDSLGYAALHGAKIASKVSAGFSHWIVPDTYFVCSPFSAQFYGNFLEIRQEAAASDYHFFCNSEGKTIKDNLHIPFIAPAKELNMCRADVHQKSTSIWAKGEWYEKRDTLPAEEQYSARHFDLADVFENLPEEKFKKHTLKWHFEISNWDQYRAFLGSGYYLNRPSEGAMPERTFLHPYGVDYEYND